MGVSHETIYQSLFVQGRGELRCELARSGRAARKPRGTTDGRGRILGMVMLSKRPAEADDRAAPGHWKAIWSLARAAAAPWAPSSSAPRD